MQLLRVRGALVPHAPLLLPEITSSGDTLRDIWDGMSRVRLDQGSPVIVLTPHATAVGVYQQASGSLASFGAPDITAAFPTGTHTMSLDRLAGPLDHGGLVPLMLFDVKSEVTVIGLPETANLTETAEVVGTVRDLAVQSGASVLVSAHTSACLTERAPLPYSFDAVRLESNFITDIERDCSIASDLADGLATVGGSCSPSTLRAFGMLFAGTEGTVLAYGAPFGVGYPVVTAEVDV